MRSAVPVMHRDRKRLWPVLLLLVAGLGLFAGLSVLVVSMVFGAMKTSGAYLESVALAKSLPPAQAALGTPIREGWLVTGAIQTSDSEGEAELGIPLSGPNGKGTLYVSARMAYGAWDFKSLDLEMAGTGKRIDLLAAAFPEEERE